MHPGTITLILFALFAGADPISDLMENLPLNSCMNSGSMNNWLNSYTSLIDMHYKTLYSNSMSMGQITSTVKSEITSATTDNLDVIHTSGIEKNGGAHTSGVKSNEVMHTSGMETIEGKHTPGIESHAGNPATGTEKTGYIPISSTENNKELRTSGTENNGAMHTSGKSMENSGTTGISSMMPGTLSGKSSREAPFILFVLLAEFSALFL